MEKTNPNQNPNPLAHPAHVTGARREKLAAASFDLVPFQEITDAYVAVAEHGAAKYAPWNWVKGLPRRQLLSSLARHVFARLRGEMVDIDSGLPHSYHILWNAVALVHHEMHGLGAAESEEVRTDEDYVVRRAVMQEIDSTSFEDAPLPSVILSEQEKLRTPLGGKNIKDTSDPAATA